LFEVFQASNLHSVVLGPRWSAQIMPAIGRSSLKTLNGLSVRSLHFVSNFDSCWIVVTIFRKKQCFVTPAIEQQKKVWTAE